MSLIAEGVFGSPLLEHTLAANPDVVLRLEDIRKRSDEPARFVFWTSGGDVRSLEAGLDGDPTIGAYRRLGREGDARLYRLTLSEQGEATSLYPVAVEHDIVVLELRVTNEGKRALARVPEREALVAYRDACIELGHDFRLERLYREEAIAEDGGVGGRYGLTGPQREALETALEMGYFEVPRRTSLEDVAAELGVSRQAASTRLRRGQTSLLRSTIS